MICDGISLLKQLRAGYENRRVMSLTGPTDRGRVSLVSGNKNNMKFKKKVGILRFAREFRGINRPLSKLTGCSFGMRERTRKSEAESVTRWVE